MVTRGLFCLQLVLNHFTPKMSTINIQRVCKAFMGSSISDFHLRFFILEHVAEQMDEDYNRALWDPTGC